MLTATCATSRQWRHGHSIFLPSFQLGFDCIFNENCTFFSELNGNVAAFFVSLQEFL